MSVGRVLENFWKRRLNAVQHAWTDKDLEPEPQANGVDDPWGEVTEPVPQQGRTANGMEPSIVLVPPEAAADGEGGGLGLGELDAVAELVEPSVFDEGWDDAVPRNDDEADVLAFDLGEWEGELDVLPPWDNDAPPDFSVDLAADGEADLDLPAYDPEARRDVAAPGDDLPVADRAVLRANHLAALAEAVTRAERRQWVEMLKVLFMEFPHGATYLAVAGLVEGGIDLGVLVAAWAIKSEWDARPQWWVRRRIRRDVEWMAGTARYDMTWRTAHAVVAAFPDDDHEYLLESWWDNWLSLSPADQGYNGFASFIRLRLELEAEQLDEGLHAHVAGGAGVRFSMHEFLRDRGM